MKKIISLVLLIIFSSCNHRESKEEKITDKKPVSEERTEIKLDKSLISILDTIHHEDQDLRRQIREIEKKFGRNSDEIKSTWEAIAEKDSLNLIKIQKILDERGWLGQDIIGRQGNMTLFLVIQHSDLEIQEKYLPMMREAVEKGNAESRNLALLEDRVALGKGEKQIYGSQIGRNQETGEFYVKPIDNPENVDIRREKVGLGTLADYVSDYNITWDVEKHKTMSEKN